MAEEVYPPDPRRASGDLILEADYDRDGFGRFSIRTGGVEQAAIEADGTGTGLLTAGVHAATSKDASSNNFSSAIFTVALTGSTPVPAGLFAIKVGGQTFNSVFDPMMGWGYNWNSQSVPPVAGEPGMFWQIEADYNDGSPNRKMESYCQVQTASTSARPFFTQYDATNDAILTVALTSQSLTWNYTPGAGGTVQQQFKIFDTSNTTLLQLTSPTGFFVSRIQLIGGSSTNEIRTAGGSGNLLQIQCATGGKIQMGPNGFSAPELTLGSATVGFYNSAGAAKQTVTGAKGSNAALASLLTALVAIGLITDSTTA